MSKTIKEIVKEIQFLQDITIAEIAKSIGYSRVYLTKEMKKDDNPGIRQRLLEKYGAMLQKVTNNTSKKEGDSWEPPLDDLIEERVMLKTLINHVMKIEAVLYNRPLKDVQRDFDLDTRLVLKDIAGGALLKQ